MLRCSLFLFLFSPFALYVMHLAEVGQLARRVDAVGIHGGGVDERQWRLTGGAACVSARVCVSVGVRVGVCSCAVSVAV